MEPTDIFLLARDDSSSPVLGCNGHLTMTFAPLLSILSISDVPLSHMIFYHMIIQLTHRQLTVTWVIPQSGLACHRGDSESEFLCTSVYLNTSRISLQVSWNRPHLHTCCHYRMMSSTECLASQSYNV